jgi:hypothetical protein
MIWYVCIFHVLINDTKIWTRYRVNKKGTNKKVPPALPLYTYFRHRFILGLPSTSGFQLYAVPWTWGITRDGQGCHHLPPTPQPWGTRQTKVGSSLDTMSMLSTTTLVLYRVIRLYREPSTEYPPWGWMTN